MRGAWLRVLGLIAFVAVLAGAGGWWMMRGQTGETSLAAPSRQAEPAAAATATPLPAIDRDSLTLPGIVEPYESVPVSAKLTATIVSMKVRDGSTVAKGQLLCALDDVELRRQIDAAQLAVMQAEEVLRRSREERGSEQEREKLALATAEREMESYRTESQLRVQQAEAARKRAERDLADQRALHEAKAVSADEVRAKQEAVEDAARLLDQTQAAVDAGLASRTKAVEQAQLDVRVERVSKQDIAAYELAEANARAELAERERRLADLRVVAPVGGTVRIIARTRTSAMMATGQSAEVLGPGVRVYEGDPFLEIATTERSCVRVEVDETDIARIHVGMKAKITGDAFAGRQLEGEVAEIQISGRRAGRGVSLFPVTVVITSPLEGVRMGMTADVTIKLSPSD